VAINRQRVWVGALVGGAVFNVRSIASEFWVAPALEAKGHLSAALAAAAVYRD